MSENPFSLWVYLSQSLLLWLTVTLLVYATADAASLATRRHPRLTPRTPAPALPLVWSTMATTRRCWLVARHPPRVASQKPLHTRHSR